MSTSKQSPFKSPPLRQPGDSIRARILDRFAGEFAWLVVGFTVVGIVIGINIGLQIGGRFGFRISNATSLAIMGVAVAVILGLSWCLNRLVNRSIAKSEKEGLGLTGERIVADALDDLKRDGHRVFHDVPPESDAHGLANFDHVVIGPTGVFVIETKARSKRDGAENRIVVEADGRLLVNGIALDRCPIKQAKALRNAMKAMLERQTSLRDIFVRGVVIFPEWQIDDKAYRKAGGDIWTLHQEAFKKWLRSGRDTACLSSADIALLSSRIEDHVRRETQREPTA